MRIESDSSVAIANRATPSTRATGRHHVVRNEPAEDDAGAEEGEPRQQRVGAVDEHVEHQPRGEPDGGDVSHEVRWPSNARSVAHHSIPAPASAAAMPIVAIHGVASVKMAADTANMAP